MRILMVTPFFYEPPQAKIGTMRLAKQLASRGHLVTVLSSAVEGAKPSEMVAGVNVIRQPVIYLKNVPVTIPYTLEPLRRLVNSFSPNVIHAHEPIFPSSIGAAWAAKTYDTPFVVTLHGSLGASGKVLVDLFTGFAESTISSIVARLSDRVVLLNESMRSRASRLRISDSKLAVVPNGVEIIEDENCAREFRQQIQGRNTFVIGFVGRLYPIKGVDLLCSAIRKILKMDSSIMFVIIGDGPLRTMVDSLAREFPSNCMHIPYLQNANTIMPAFDLLVLPSLSEGLPTVVIESFAAGVPVLASEIAGNSSIIQNEKTGILFPPGCLDSLVEATLQLRNTDLSALRKNCKRVAIESYSWKSVMPRLMSVYEEASQMHEKKK